MTSKCCINCFDDRGIKSQIEFLSKETGTCSYCRSTEVPLTPPAALLDKFETLIAVYEQRHATDSKLLVTWLRSDWSLFSSVHMDDAHAKELISDIFDNGELVRQHYIPSAQYESNKLGNWQTLRQELLHENRFFPQTHIDFSRLESLLSQLLVEPQDIITSWYRARIGSSDKAYEASEMQAPPAKIASHGRANPAGIPYLYLGSTNITAVSEIRPHTGEVVYLADFSTPEKLLLVDLRNPRKNISPFLLADEEDIGQMRSDLDFLEQLGNELTRPVLPHAAAFDYTPSQYICEFIKKCGFDGVLYSSSVSEGVNLALFNPRSATNGAITKKVVTKVSVSIYDL